MNTTEFINFAKDALAEHSLKGWSIELDRASRRLGCCKHRLKALSFSRVYVEKGEQKDILNTLLHEIAHALTPGHGHDRVWAAKAKEIGCNGERCTTLDNPLPVEFKYTAFCLHCKKEVGGYMRRPNLALGHKHAACNQKITWVDNKKGISL